MALSLVGRTYDLRLGNSNLTISLTSLTGGSNTSPSQGDFVLVIIGVASNSNTTPTCSTTGFTLAGSQLYGNDTYDTCHSVYYKFMGSTPDTSITITGGGGTLNNSFGAIVYVYRNVNTSTPIAIEQQSLINRGNPTPPSITPTVSGSKIIIAGVCNTEDNAHTFSTPSGYSNRQTVHYSGKTPTYYIDIMSADKDWTSGIESPGVFTINTDSTNYSSCASTIVLIPSAKEFTISENLSLVESITNLRGLQSTISETLGISETWTALKGILFTISETITTSEVWTTTRGLVSTVIDTLGLSEIVTLVKKWTNQSKSSSTWSNSTKNTSTFTNQTKNTSNWDNQNKS